MAIRDSAVARCIARLLFVAGTVTSAAVTAQTPPPTPETPPPDSNVAHWARRMAIPVRSVDQPYVDSSFAFLGPLVGHARIFAIGELIHGAHEPLSFRNELIRYAVTHLGFTAVALETGITEAAIVDRFIQGGPGNVDSVVRTGFTWGFEKLPENRDLVLWLRAHNAHATTKVHFYGLDITGGDDDGIMPRAGGAVLATLTYLDQVSPAAGASLRTRLLPLMDRFMPSRYAEYSATDRDLLERGLDDAYQALRTDSSRDTRATSRLSYARALRNAWEAVRLNEIMAAGFSSPASMLHSVAVRRDSTMAENVDWVLRQLDDGGRLVVFAHNAHVMNAATIQDGATIKMLGQYLRARFATNLVVLGAATSTVVGGTGGIGGWLGDSGEAHADPLSFAAALAQAGRPTFVLDRRTGDRAPDVAAALARRWPLMFVSDTATYPPLVPHDAFDAIAYFDHVTPSKVH